MVPTNDADWARLLTLEWQDFQTLCQYLLNDERVDLLILAVDFRVPKRAEGVTYSKTIMEKASQIASLSTYQKIKCQLRCGPPARVILRFEWSAGTFKLKQFYQVTSTKPSKLASLKGSRNLLHEDEIDVKAFGNIPAAVYFYDMRSMKPIFWREEAAYLLSGRVQTIGLSDIPEFEHCYAGYACSRCQWFPSSTNLNLEYVSAIAKIKSCSIANSCYLIHLLYWMRALEPATALLESEIERYLHPKNILFLNVHF